MHRVIYVSIFSCNLKYITFAGSAVLFAVAHDFAHHVARLWVNFFRKTNEFELNVAKRERREGNRGGTIAEIDDEDFVKMQSPRGE